MDVDTNQPRLCFYAPWVIDALKMNKPQLFAPSVRSDVRCDVYKQSLQESQCYSTSWVHQLN